MLPNRDELADRLEKACGACPLTRTELLAWLDEQIDHCFLRLKAPESSALKLIELSYAEWLDELINPNRFYEQNRIKPGFKTKPLIIPDDIDTMAADDIEEMFENQRNLSRQRTAVRSRTPEL